MGTERELKFTVTDGWDLPSLTGLCSADAEATIEFTATYYDTPDLRLARAGASLRHREDGWTVKLPIDDHTGGALVRTEQVFSGMPGAPPAAALDLVAALVRTSRLAPVARLHTSRRPLNLRTVGESDGELDGGDRLPAGQLVAVLTDDRCTVLEGHVRTTFREIEVEIEPDADDAVVEAVSALLRASGASDADPTPKVRRALGPVADGPPDVVPTDVDQPATVARVIRHALSESVYKLVTSDPVVRIGDDVEGVHQARVATRRLRSHLRTFRDLLDAEWAAALRDELGWLGDELGAVRDADVLLDRLRGRVDQLDVADRAAARPILDRLTARQAEARTVLLAALRSPRYLELLDRLVDAAHRPRVVLRIGGDDDAALRALVRKPWKQLRAAVEELPDAPPDAALHAVRIRAKRARYAAEVVEPAFGSPARDFAKAVTRVQDVLGEHQDAVVAGAWLRATALTLGDPAAVYAAGQLGAAERVAAEEARRAWPPAWRDLDRGRMRKWM